MKLSHIQLEKKQSDKHSGPQYSLWAEFIRMGHHDDYEQPPAIPLTSGEQKGRPKSSVSEVLARFAMAITNQTKCSSPTPTSNNSGNALSPNNQVNMRPSKNLKDLGMLSHLCDDGVLTEEVF